MLVRYWALIHAREKPSWMPSCDGGCQLRTPFPPCGSCETSAARVKKSSSMTFFSSKCVWKIEFNIEVCKLQTWALLRKLFSFPFTLLLWQGVCVALHEAPLWTGGWWFRDVRWWCPAGGALQAAGSHADRGHVSGKEEGQYGSATFQSDKRAFGQKSNQIYNYIHYHSKDHFK